MTEHKHNANCERLLASLGDYVEGTISPQLCQEIERHLAECENCRVVVDTLNKTIYLYHSTARQPQVPQDVRGRLFQTLKLEDYLHKTP